MAWDLEKNKYWSFSSRNGPLVSQLKRKEPPPPRNVKFEDSNNVFRGVATSHSQAWDDRMSRGVLENDVLVDSPKVLSVVEILTSSYGHPRNATKTYDISSKLRQMIEKQVRSGKRPWREHENVPRSQGAKERWPTL